MYLCQFFSFFLTLSPLFGLSGTPFSSLFLVCFCLHSPFILSTLLPLPLLLGIKEMITYSIGYMRDTLLCCVTIFVEYHHKFKTDRGTLTSCGAKIKKMTPPFFWTGGFFPSIILCTFVIKDKYFVPQLCLQGDPMQFPWRMTCKKGPWNACGAARTQEV